MVHMGRNAVRWVKKEHKVGPRSCWVCQSLSGKQAASCLSGEKREGPSLSIQHIISPSPLPVLGGSTGS